MPKDQMGDNIRRSTVRLHQARMMWGKGDGASGCGGGIGMEVEKLFSSETSFEGDTAHLVISVESWDDGCANSELFNAFCQYLSMFSDEDHYFENVVSNDGSTMVGSSVLHMKDKSTGTWMSSNFKKVLNRLLAMGSPDLIKALV